MTKFFYGRVSTIEQNLERQRRAAMDNGVSPDNCYLDKITGTKIERPALSQLIEIIQEGDEVIILSLDRLSRSMTDLLNLVETFSNKGVSIRSIHEGMTLDNRTPTGKLTLSIFAAMAEFQRNVILNNCAEGRREKIAKEGRCGGRKPLSDAKKQMIIQMKNNGYSVKQIMEAAEVSKASIYRVIRENEASAAAI